MHLRFPTIEPSLAATLALAVLLLAPAAPSASAATADARINAVISTMRADIRELDNNLADLRAGLADAALAARRAEAAHAQAQAAVEQAMQLAQVAPIGSAALAPLTSDDGFVGTQLADRARRREQLEEGLDAATTEAASTQARLRDQERRVAALQQAVRGYRGDPGAAEATGIPAYGWGGPETLPVSAASIDDYLESKASPMAGNGEAFMRSGVAHDIDPRFVVAVAGAESYFGVQTCASYNAWGWGCPNNPFAFASWAVGFDTVAKGLRENYVDDGLTTIDEIHLRYAPPAATNDPTGLNYAWPDNVAKFLTEQGGNVEDVTGPGTTGATGRD